MSAPLVKKTPTFRVTVISRTIQAVNYHHRSGATKLGFKGTELMPAAHAEAKVESKKGYIEIEVEFHGLDAPTSFGSEYLTYILWAITPEGRPVNLGEILVSGGSSKLVLGARAEVVDLPRLPALQRREHAGAMVGDVDPVPYLPPVPGFITAGRHERRRRQRQRISAIQADGGP